MKSSHIKNEIQINFFYQNLQSPDGLMKFLRNPQTSDEKHETLRDFSGIFIELSPLAGIQQCYISRILKMHPHLPMEIPYLSCETRYFLREICVFTGDNTSLVVDDRVWVHLQNSGYVTPLGFVLLV